MRPLGVGSEGEVEVVGVLVGGLEMGGEVVGGKMSSQYQKVLERECSRAVQREEGVRWGVVLFVELEAVGLMVEAGVAGDCCCCWFCCWRVERRGVADVRVGVLVSRRREVRRRDRE